MKAIIVDDNAEIADKIRKSLHEAASIQSELVTKNGQGEPRIIDFAKDDPREIAQAIVDTYPEVKEGSNPKESNDLLHILINIESRFGGAKRQDQKGTEILLWLRCKHRVRNPVILYGFQSNQQLLKKKPEYVVINSEGCHHFHLPYDFSKLKDSSLSRVNDWNTWKKYLKPAFSIEEFRHREANWWGVKCLWDVHRVRTEGKFNAEYPSDVKEKLKVLNNVIADFCYAIGVERLQDYIQKRKDELSDQLGSLEEELRNAEQQKEVTTQDISSWRSFLTSLLEKADNLKKNFLRYFANTSSEYAEIKEEIHTHEGDVRVTEELLAESEREHEKQDRSVEDIKTTIAETQRILQNLQRLIKDKLFRGDLPELSPDTKVLHIDDQAEQGWKQIFQYMIYGNKADDKFREMSFDASFTSSDTIEQKIDGIFADLKNVIDGQNRSPNFDPDVILLDVRLIPDYDAGLKHDIESMSGARLLKQIRREYPGTPVIVTTASNKIWTYEELMKLGADAYWIKEGIDEQRTAEESVENYIKFLGLVVKVSTEEYKFLKSVAGRTKRMFDSAATQKFWWEEKDWNFEYVYADNQNNEHVLIPKVTKAERNTIKEILTDALALIRQYYQVTLMGHGYDAWTKKEWYLPSQVIQHLSNIIEVVHNFDAIRNNAASLKRRNHKLRYPYYDRVETIDGYRFYENNKRKYRFKRRKDREGGELYEKRNQASHYSRAIYLKADDMKEFFQGILKYLDDPGKQTVSNSLLIRIENDTGIYDKGSNEKAE